jgi:hypothetical protein
VIFHTAKNFGHNLVFNCAGIILPEGMRHEFDEVPDAITYLFGELLYTLWRYGAQNIREQVKSRNTYLDNVLLGVGGLSKSSIKRISESDPTTTIMLDGICPSNVEIANFPMLMALSHGIETFPGVDFFHPSYIEQQYRVTGRRVPFTPPNLVRVTVADPNNYIEGANRLGEALRYYSRFR